MVFIFWVENLEKGDLNHYFFKKEIKWNLFTTFSKFLSTFCPIFLVYEKYLQARGREILSISKSYLKSNELILFGT